MRNINFIDEDNIGNVIKKTAYVLFFAGIISSFVLAICYLVNYFNEQIEELQIIHLEYFFIALLAGPAASFMALILFYGFGTIVDSSKSSDDEIRILLKMNSKVKKTSLSKETISNTNNANIDQTKNDNIINKEKEKENKIIEEELTNREENSDSTVADNINKLKNVISNDNKLSELDAEVEMEEIRFNSRNRF